jgi:hypothetical protein
MDFPNRWTVAPSKIRAGEPASREIERNREFFVISEVAPFQIYFELHYYPRLRRCALLPA